MSAPVGLLETIMKKVRTLAAACGAVALLGGMVAAPAFADPPAWAPAHGYRDKHHGRDDDAPRVIVTQPPPAVVVAPAAAPIYVAPPPPAVVYQPAPVVAPSPSIDIIVPLHLGH
jgi:hypothetical protein